MLDVPVHEERDAVGRVELRGDLARIVHEELRIERLATVGRERTGDEPIVAPVAVAADEPELILQHRSAVHRVEVDQAVDARRRFQSESELIGGHIAALKRLAGVRREQ